MKIMNIKRYNNMSEEKIEKMLWRVEGVIDRCPWMSSYYGDFLQTRLGISSPIALLLVVALHVVVAVSIFACLVYALAG